MSKTEKICEHGHRFLDDESGATAIEYVLIAAIMGVGIVASLQSLKTALSNAFTFITTAVLGA